MKILFALSTAEYLRYYDSTIALLAERGHHVLIAVNRPNPQKSIQLEDDLPAHERVLGIGLVPPRSDHWYPLAKALRGLIDFVRFLHPRYADSHALRERMLHKVLPPWPRFMTGMRLSRWQVKGLTGSLMAVERAIPSSRDIEEFLREHSPDIVLVTPLVDAASDQVDLIKSAQAMGIRTGVCIASWDNLTNKGLMRVRPDRVFVWNEIQRSEAVEFHGVKPEQVMVTGAQLFDSWFERKPSRSRDAFCERVGLPTDRPFIVFVGSSKFIAGSDKEVLFVRKWIEALRSNPSLAGSAILVRPHPYNTRPWEQADFSDLPDVTIWPRGSYQPWCQGSRDDYYDTLFYSRAVIGVNTSAMIEAAILGRPVFSLLSPEFNGTQEGTLHFHYLLPENGGFLRVASNNEEHVKQLEEALRQKDGGRDQILNFVQSFIRPHGIDTPCTPLLAEAIEELGTLTPFQTGFSLQGALLRAMLSPLTPLAAHAYRKRKLKRKAQPQSSAREGKAIEVPRKVVAQQIGIEER